MVRHTNGGSLPSAAVSAEVAALLAALLLLGAGCRGRVTTGKQDAGSYITWDTRIPNQDGKVYPDGMSTVDATAKAGELCTYGKCAKNLICMANVCHTICSSECGDKAPECQGTEGCHWVTSFSAACMPGTAQYGQKCGNGVWCVGGNQCVRVTGVGTKCLRLCKYGCASGASCVTTTTGCKVCNK